MDSSIYKHMTPWSTAVLETREDLFRGLQHDYILNIWAVGLSVSEKKIP